MIEMEISLCILSFVLTAVGSFLTFASYYVATTWGQNQEKERELRERSDMRSNDRQERDSIRKNFDLQRARMPKMETTELIAFSQAAAAEVKKREAKRAEAENLKKEIQRLGGILAAHRPRQPQIEPSRQGLGVDRRRISEGWERVGSEGGRRMRSNPFHGGFTSQQRDFRDLARRREGMESPQDGLMMDIAGEQGNRLRRDRALVVGSPPMLVEVTESRAREQKTQRHRLKTEIEAEGVQKLAA